jgi:cytochrome c-type biogenesis protein CcmH/NrfG
MALKSINSLTKQPNQSIHPDPRRPVKDTSKKPSPKTKLRLIAAIEAHLENHPNDGISHTRLVKLKAS